MHKDLTNKDYRSWINLLCYYEKRSRKDIEEHQLFMLRNVWLKRALQTPGYQELYKTVGITDAKDIQTWRDFRKLPTIDKEMIRTGFTTKFTLKISPPG